MLIINSIFGLPWALSTVVAAELVLSGVFGGGVKYVVSSTDMCRTLDHHMGLNNGALTHHNSRTDDTVGTYCHRRVQIGIRVNDGGGMNHRLSVRTQNGGRRRRLALN